MIERPRRNRRLMTVLGAVILTAALLGLVVIQWRQERQSLLAAARVQTMMLGNSASAALAFGDHEAAGDIIYQTLRIPLVEAAALVDADGKTLAQLGTSSEEDLTSKNLNAETHYFTKQNLTVIQPVSLEKRRVGSVMLKLSLSGLNANLLRFALSLGGIGIFASLLYLITSRRLRQRIDEAENALHHMALHDRLTSLPNRLAFEILLKQCVTQHLRTGDGSALLFIDTDGFKRVNDKFGHEAGDQVLLELALRLRNSLRSADVVARLGGDEFAIILAGTANPNDVENVTQQLLKVMEAPFQVRQELIHLGLSIGIAMIPADGTSGEDLLRNADMAMYYAKAKGKNRAEFFAATIAHEVHKRLDIENALRMAVANEQLFIAYQPQVSAANGHIVGMEALLRWQHPERGLVSPADFIPIAEESGLILELGRWVMERVCQDIALWRKAGLQVPPVAINVSARQFNRGQLVDEISSALKANGLSPLDLELELTESVIMSHADSHAQVLVAMRRAGLRLTIDDFGTGYASLAYLKRLPVEKLKIDRSFIIDLVKDFDDQAIVTAIISIAKALGLKVVAEGVETEAQADILRRFECDIIQGYLTGRPMEKDRITPLLLPTASTR